MTRRRRYANKSASPRALQEIEAPALARGARESRYPSPKERLRLIARRDELSKALIQLFVQGKAAGGSQFDKLAAEYGAREVLHVTEVLGRQFQRSDFRVDEPQAYRRYRLGFARFGGARRFLSKSEQDELSFERAMLYGKREFKSLFRFKPSPRERELGDLLLTDWPFWEDITPPNIPPRPADYPAPASYPPPASRILTWGWNLDPGRISRQRATWQAFVPELERMVFDETLLNGWPGEPASWAPWHALHLLGALRAVGNARRLVDLFNHPNDWLSDCLPAVWAQMGSSVEPILWDILDDPACKPDQRGLAVAGLAKLVENKTIPRLPVVRALAGRLSPGRVDNALVNAYIIFVLDKLHAVEAKDAVRAAYKNKLVDTKTMDLQSVTFLYD